MPKQFGTSADIAIVSHIEIDPVSLATTRHCKAFEISHTATLISKRLELANSLKAKTDLSYMRSLTTATLISA